MATHATVWTGVLSSSATSIAVGQAVVLDSDGYFRIATTANRASYGRARGVAKSAASGVNASFEYQVAGILSDADSGIADGSAGDWVIVDANGNLERDATPDAGEDVIGRCPHTNGDVQIAPGVWDSSNTSPGGGAASPGIFGADLAHFWGDNYSKPTATSALWPGLGAEGENLVEAVADADNIPTVGTVNGHAYPVSTGTGGDEDALQLENVDTFDGLDSLTVFGCFKLDPASDTGGAVVNLNGLFAVGFVDVTGEMRLDWQGRNPAGGSAVLEDAEGSTPMNDGEWHRFVWVVDEKVSRFYLDGVHVPEMDVTFTWPLDALSAGTADLLVFSDWNGNSYQGGATAIGLATRAASIEEVMLLDSMLAAWVGAGGSSASASIDTVNTTVKQGYAEINTTDATPTTVTFTDVAGGANFSTIPLPDDSSVEIVLSAIMNRSGGSKSKRFKLGRDFLIDGSSVVTADAQRNLEDPRELGGTSTATVAIEYTGTNARVDFTGVAGNEIRTRLDIQIVTVEGPVFSGAAPTVNSVTPDLADPDGGTTHVIAGSDFTGVTTLTVGGTNVPSFTVDSDTQITFTMPARAIGASLSVVATNPTGSNGANTLFEVWGPEAWALTLGQDKIKNPYDGTTWPGFASAGASGSRSFTQTTPTNRPADSGGEPDYDGVDNYLSTTVTVGDVFNCTAGANAGTLIAVWDADTADAPVAAQLDPALFTDSGPYTGLYFNTDGINAFILDTVRRIVTTAAATGQRHVSMMRFSTDGGGTGLVRLSHNGSVDVDSEAIANINAGAAAQVLQLGMNYDITGGFDGRERTIIALASEISDADYNKFRKWAQVARGAV